MGVKEMHNLKRFLPILAFFLCSFSLFGAGSSGDYLLSPENDETGSKQFGSSTDKLDRGGWYFDGNRGYARKNGVALRANGNGTLCYDFPEGTTDNIYNLVVTCRTATKGSVGKEQTLSVGLVGVEETVERTFTTSSQTSETSLTFTFPDFPEVTGFRFTNLGETIFEIASVEWLSTYPDLSVNYYVQSKVIVAQPLNYAINQITGGSSDYTLMQLTFNGETHTYSGNDFPISGAFTAPMTSGDFPFTILVKDSKENEFTTTQTVTVTPYGVPTPLKATNVTTDSFDLSWELTSGVTPKAYKVVVALNPMTKKEQFFFAPTWELQENGYWVTAEDYDLSYYTKGFKLSALMAQCCGSDPSSFEYSGDGGKTWTKGTKFGSQYLLITSKVANQRVMFRTQDAETPRYISLMMTTNRKVLEETFVADAQVFTHTVKGIPAGATLDVTLVVMYDNNGATVSMQSDTIQVTTGAIPTFTSVQNYEKWKLLQLTWPECEMENLSGEVNILSVNAVEYATPKGLYLTRVYLTNSKNGLTTGKAVAITNTTNVPIYLNGQYTLKSVKQDTGTTRTWDFSQKDAENNKIYPYIIKPGEDLIISHATYAPHDLREGVATTTSQVLNFTDAWELSLMKGETVCNTITPQLNTLVRLAEDSLETLDCTEIVAKMQLDKLYQPWTKIEETLLLHSLELDKTSTLSQLNYAPYLTLKSSTRRVVALCQVTSGEARSMSTEVVLWEAPLPKKGFRFSLR